MTLVASRPHRTRRPFAVTLLIVLLAVLGMGAVGGGLAMILGIGGESFMPDEYLDALPLVDDWVVPGLVLLLGFGIGSLVAMYGVLRRPGWPALGWLEERTGHHWSWLLTMAIGWGQVAWILIEVVSIPFSALMPTFGLVGLALALLPLTRAVRLHLAI
jgi:hypothetical protein